MQGVIQKTGAYNFHTMMHSNRKLPAIVADCTRMRRLSGDTLCVNIGLYRWLITAFVQYELTRMNVGNNTDGRLGY